MMRETLQIVQHFSEEEKGFVEKIIDLCRQVEDSYVYRVTPFLNPRQDEIVAMVANHYQLQYLSSRECVTTEYTRAIIAPAYYQVEEQDFEIGALELSYARKFHSLTHSQVLGTFLNRLGIRRDYIGDILVEDGAVVVFLDAKFVALALQEITKISRVPVKLSSCQWNQVEMGEHQEIKLKDVLVSSLRLDQLVSAAFPMSRTIAAKWIESGMVKLDYVQVSQPSKLVELGQLISVRKYGRIRLDASLGQSKKGKTKLTLAIIKH